MNNHPPNQNGSIISMNLFMKNVVMVLADSGQKYQEIKDLFNKHEKFTMA